MAQQTDPFNLLDTWRALLGKGEAEGWNTISLESPKNCALLAGRYLPDNTEAILIGFQNISIPAVRNLPQGQGFRIERIESIFEKNKRIWISLSRYAGSQVEMFSRMAEDVIRTVHAHPEGTEKDLFMIFINRIRAWQSFMEKDGFGVLGKEAETGLFGELFVLEALLDQDIPLSTVPRIWTGPAGNIHDFLLGVGALEVKTTISKSSFPAQIASLEQLDNTLVYPLFLAGVRLLLQETGLTLPEYIERISNYFKSDAFVRNEFQCRLIQAGYIESFADHYVRRFIQMETRFYEINDSFPRLTRDNISSAITKATYEIDLALVLEQNLQLSLSQIVQKTRGNHN